MLYKLFGFLFRNDGMYRYTAHPLHLSYAVLLLGVGAVTLSQDWFFFGTMCCIFGVGLGATILLAINWDKSIEYWDTIARIFEAAIRIKDATTRYELLKSMGYKVLPSQVEVLETRRDEHGVFQGQSIKRYPVSPAIMQTLADKVLGEYITKGTVEFDFKEDQFSFVPNIRKVKKAFTSDKIITQKNAKNYRLGYRWTRKGINELYQYASEGVKLEIERKRSKDV